jgi:ABC-2 type transport system ATP-binding protein
VELQFAFGLHRHERVDSLSFGGRMKLAIVLALSRDAELLVLDEPTLGLDAIARRQFFTELLRFMQGENRTILISSHQLTDLERFADHVAIINQGKLLASGRMDQLVERYEQVDAQVGRETALALAGINIIAREGNRVRLLIDRHSMPADGFAQLDIKDVQQVPLTLEELFLTLIRVANGRSGWWPQMSAA